MIGLLDRIKKLHQRQTLKRDIEGARWWCSLIDVDQWNAQRQEMTDRVEVAWQQKDVHFPQALHDGTPGVVVIWFDRVGHHVFHAEETSFQGKPARWYPLVIKRGADIDLTDLQWPL